METGKYQHLFKPLKIAEIPGQEQFFKNTGNADINRWLNGRDHLEGVELNFSWGFYTGLGDWHPGMDPHVHPYPECLVFVGLDPDRPEYLGAELQYCLGKELEIHTFDKPTCIAAPGGFLHCPSVTLDVTSPIGYSFFIISLGADPTTYWMGDGISEEQMARMRPDPESEVRSPMNSHFSKKRVHISEETVSHGDVNAHYLKPMVPNTMTVRTPTAEDTALYGEMLQDGRRPGPGLSKNAVWMFGKDLEGMDLNFCWSIHTQPGLWVRGPGKGAHVHPYDEVLVFAGTEPADIDYLGAEIQIDVGEEHERHIINEPTAVVLPAGTPHCPIVTRYVDKPFGVLMMSLGKEHKTTYID
jgi:hypothetical protein